jgi:aminoglycoside phosphotransferase (APT) family kinase protein
VDEVRFGRDMVRALLRDQHPDLADLRLRDIDGGWDNQQWRLGDELVVRLPRTVRAPALLRQEQRWLPVLAPRLPLPTPVPVRVGEPSPLFEHPWTIARWVGGDPADQEPITHPGSAGVLAGFLRALHTEAPEEAPTNPTRGIPLAEMQQQVSGKWYDVIADHEYADAARRVWQEAAETSAWEGPRTWLHGDLHPANVVVRGGALAGVIDFGDMCAGDPATDLSAAWILLPAGTAQQFFEVYDRADDATVARARGWAVLRALGLIMIGQNGRRGLAGGKPTWEPAGYATLDRLLTTN